MEMTYGATESKRNPGLFQGKRFWCGAYDVTLEKVVETHTYEACEALDFQSYWAFTDQFPAEIAEYLFDSGKWIFFWLDNKEIVFEPEVESKGLYLSAIRENIWCQEDIRTEREGEAVISIEDVKNTLQLAYVSGLKDEVLDEIRWFAFELTGVKMD